MIKNINRYNLNLKYTPIEKNLLSKSTSKFDLNNVELSTLLTFDFNNFFLSPASRVNNDEGYMHGRIVHNNEATELSILLVNPLSDNYKIFLASKPYDGKYVGKYTGMWAYDYSIVDSLNKDSILNISRLIKDFSKSVSDCTLELQKN